MSHSALLIGMAEEVGAWLRRELPSVEVRVADGADALSIPPPDLVIVSERTAQGSGEEVVARVRDLSPAADVPIIFCLSSTSDPDLPRRLVRDQKVDRLMMFPLDRRELVQHAALLLDVKPETHPEPDVRGGVAAGVAALWERFRDQIFARIEVLEGAGVGLLGGGLDEEQRRAAEREAHKLAGSVGTFGFLEGSRLAREAEEILRGDAPIEAVAAKRFSEFVVRLRDSIEQGEAAPARNASVAESARLLLVSNDDVFATSVGATAGRRSLPPAVFGDARTARERLLRWRPEIAIVDLSGGGEAHELVSLVQLLADVDPPVPTIVVGTNASAWDRVQATRMGATSFLRKPVPASRVVAEAERLLQRQKPERGRIVAVDDDPHVLAALDALLAREGFEVTTYDDPLRVLDALEEDAPDLLVLDLDMPHLSGVELCRVIRSDPRLHGLPILVLTAAREPEVVQRVYRAGADDFVSKPIVEQELMARISNRLERSRLFRDMADRDFVTGIANRRRAMELIEQLRRIADRQQKPLALAVLDIDHFKSVNDRYGHATGDRVLAHLAEFLIRTFRGEDVVGRWGGEEFVLGMFGMDTADGIFRLERALQEMAQEEIDDGAGGTFTIRFSAGLAVYPKDAADIQSLYDAADAAMYQAKKAGRGRVRAAGAEVTPAAEAPTGYDVVLVEDDEALGALLIHSIEARGYRTHWLRDGQEALDWLVKWPETQRARVVLLDVDLPGMDGLTLLRHLNHHGVTRGTRVIMLTARAGEKEVVDALRTGAFDHVAKPFSVPVLVQRVRRALEV